MHYFCTYFDQHYLPKALALYRSLQKHCPDFRLWVLCMDQAAHDLLTQLSLPEVTPIALADFEQHDDQLQSAKENRSKIEYYFTCTPSLPLYILNRWSEVDLITYLDADLFFFYSPQPLYEEMKEGSIGIVAHRFPPSKKAAEIYGLYNVGWLMFRRDENALACLQWWRERCIEWCYDWLDGDRFADQKYLDQWPARFQGVVVLEHKGANLAPWNVEGYHLTYNREKETVLVDEQPLIFFHFHGLRRMQSWLYDPKLRSYGVVPAGILRNKIYAPYVVTLQEIYEHLAQRFTADRFGGGIRDKSHSASSGDGNVNLWAKSVDNVYLALRILSGQYYLVTFGGHVL